MATKIVGMADLAVVKHPDVLTTIGLGSCLGIAFYDASSKIGGLAHVMLPDSTRIRNNTNEAKFVDTAIAKMLNDMMRMGAKRDSIKAKIAGGAQMFPIATGNDMMKIGDNNIDMTMSVLRTLRIPILAQDVGLNYGRTVELHTDDGRFVIKTIGYGVKIL
jgi:chemotaxis protein CheD